jgi:putative ABC transport system permease protein
MNLEWLSELRLRIAALLHRRRLDRDLEEELQFHLAERADRHLREGFETHEAARLSRRQFGNVTAWKETSRDMWTFRWLEALSQDLRFTLRSLAKSRVFTLVVVLTLTLGIGSTAAIFSVFDAVVLKPLPYPEPAELVLLLGNVQREVVERRGTSLADYADWRAQSESFEDMALYYGEGAALQGIDEPVRIAGEVVAQPYFDLLGVSPIWGRTFLPEEDEVIQRDAVVVLGGGLWQRQFGGDPGIVGRVIRLDERSYSVVGVMPEWFRGITDQAEFWLPLHMANAEMFEERGTRGPSVLARLKPNVSLSQAQAEMDEICRRLERTYPETNEGRGVELSPLDRELFGDIRQPLIVLLGAVALVLLIACTNVANLLLVRSEARQREVAVRTALGAGRARVFGQLTVESCLLSFIGAGAGLLLAYWGVGLLMAVSPVTLPSYVQPSVDLRVALFAAALTGLVGVLLGLAPAFHLRSVQLQDVFKQASRGSTAGAQGRGFRNVLVVAEVAMAMLLLIGSGLFMRSLQQMTKVRLGYEPTQVLTLRVGMLLQDDAQRQSQMLAMISAAAEVPGVESVAAGTDSPLTNGGAQFYSAEGQPEMNAQDRPRAYTHRVTPDFFEVLQIPLIAGRAFDPSELNDPPRVVIVSESVVRRFWPGEDAIGKRIKLGDASSTRPWLTIVGVVNEMKYRGLPENPTADPDLFLPFDLSYTSFALLARTTVDPASAASAIREALLRSGPPLITYNVEPMQRLVDSQTGRQQFTTWLMSVFAVSALLLATIGIYGVLCYTVTRRSQEFSIRMALGAERREVLRLVTANGLALTGMGLLAGAGASLALTRLFSGLLYGVTPRDPATFAVAGAVLAAVALLASLAPALRASRTAPAAALRQD